jgi:hypothetical protein
LDTDKRNNEMNHTALALDRAIDSYIKKRREKVPAFVKKHFSFTGALRLNRKVLSSDLYKTPLNVFWAMPYTGLKVSSLLIKKIGFKRIPSYMNRLPVGFETNLQKEINWLIFTELLELPYAQDKRKSQKDALAEEIFNQPEISSLFIHELSVIKLKSKDQRFRDALERNLRDYSGSRIATSELAGSIISLSAGAGMFGKMTPGAMTFGGGLASAIAQYTAISNFILGPTLGGIYYSIFPATASMGLLVASTGTVLAALALVTSFSGIITDPIQSKLGLHQKRLNRLIDSLDKELRGMGDSGLHFKERYIARIFDLLDLFRAAARTMV